MKRARPGAAHESPCSEIDHVQVELWAPGEKQVMIGIAVTNVNGRRLLPAELIWPLEGDEYL